ncbi:tyrosine-type recombinase/integrase [Glycomyces sp. NRRL B-16210]|uniref:tyrosine-type recombinase/integrase n=1 Tax=Glycomyces sp. NRRL B-16210 TaxID=1463821 RepID=UPI0004BF145A|nr:tyrosine-type recombinase/integrase [Glycomyces sp. NRRL B-16210]
MGYCNKKTNRFGQERWTAMFLDRHGIARSAGTYDSEEEGNDAWREAEKKVQAGKGDVLVRGRTLFREYVEETWLPHLTVEVKTREVYTYQLYAHLMAFFGDRPMLDIYTTDIKEWLSELKDQGVSATTRKRLKQLLSSILGSAVSDRYLAENPCLLVKTDPVPKKPLTIITPAQFDVFYVALPDAMSKLLVETAIETGTRWGELTELRVSDWDPEHKAFTVCRAVVQIRPEFHPESKRFFVKDYPKDGEYRLIKVAGHLAEKIDAHIEANNLKENNLLFWYEPQARLTSTCAKVELGKPSGRTKRNRRGQTFAHGTMSAYTAGRCRCAYCREAMAAYRRKRRASGKDNPRKPRVWDTDGHIPNRWFREQIIKPALRSAGIKVDIRMHLLRHAHASWLLNGGADLMVVKERLGHASITTTERYLHTVANADETALAALDKVRQHQRREIPSEPDNRNSHHRSEPMSNEQLLAQMASLQAELTKRLGGSNGGAAAA